MSSISKPISPIALTPGEPAGIGPDIVCELLTHWQGHPLVIVACPDLMASRAQQLNLEWEVPLYDSNISAPISILPVTCSHKPPSAGHLNANHAHYVLETLTLASKGCQTGEFSALVTGPVHKGVINEARVPFTGHTEWLQAYTHTNDVLMTFLNPIIPCALLTTHHPLREVTQHITHERVCIALQLLHTAMQDHTGSHSPHIGIAGINPHAGENGHLGDEEQRILIPAIEQSRRAGIHCSDPIPADTLFTPPARQPFDAILSMYHDQGLPVIKALAFGKITQITLGLPFLRLSVDHGTALSLAGTGQARADSLQLALERCEHMLQQHEASHP